MAVAGPSLPSAYAAAHVLKYKLPAFHRLKFLPALLSVPSGRYGSRTPIYCPNKSERVRPPVHQKKPLEQIKTRVCSSAQSRHTHTRTHTDLPRSDTRLSNNYLHQTCILKNLDPSRGNAPSALIGDARFTRSHLGAARYDGTLPLLHQRSQANRITAD